MRLSLKELKDRRDQGRIAVDDRRPSGIPVEVLLEASGAIEEPVGLARALTGFGLSLAVAHDVLNRIVAGEAVPVTLYMTADGDTPFALTGFGLRLSQRPETRPPARLDGVLPDEVRESFEGWRRSQPAQPSTDVALGLIVRAYLTEHGLLRRTELRAEAEPYETT